MDPVDRMALTRSPERYDFDLGGGETAFALVREEGDVVTVYHTEVPRRLRGSGNGARLVTAVLDDIRARGRKVRPRCPFVAAFIRDNPQYADLLA
jgi:predicted GNAT family acetyltransferase